MKYRSKPVEVEANQFTKRGECPLGVFTREDGTHYVITTQGQAVPVQPGEWIIIENPPGDGTRAYPCSDEVFKKRYEPAK